MSDTESRSQGNASWERGRPGRSGPEARVPRILFNTIWSGPLAQPKRDQFCYTCATAPLDTICRS